jgi:hypothetical protein
LDVHQVTDELPLIDGDLIRRRRGELGLSREHFAQLVDMRPGSIWRLEVRNVFKPEEREYLATIADRWLVGDASAAPKTSIQPLKRASSTRPTRRIVVPANAVTAAQIFYEEDEDVVQWVDALKPDLQRRLEIVIPFGLISPTALSLLDGCTRVSNSEVQTFKRCRRKWWLAYVRGMQLFKDEPFGARATGTRLHAALAAWYRPDDEKQVDPRDALEIIIENERAQLEKRLDADLESESLKKFNQDVELERIVIAGYMEWIAETGADSEYKIIGSERYLEADLPEMKDTKIIARLDARVIRRHDNARLFIDHKSVAGISQAVQLLPMNEQMQWYILLEELQPDRDPKQRVGGALYNMLRRCKRTAAAKPPFYQRVEVHHNPIEIASFRKRLVGTLDDMKYCRDELAVDAQPHQLIVYPSPTRDCSWDCQFLKICTMADDGSRFEDALEAHYVVGDPYGYYASSTEKSDEDK